MSMLSKKQGRKFMSNFVTHLNETNNKCS